MYRLRVSLVQTSKIKLKFIATATIITSYNIRSTIALLNTSLSNISITIHT